jgi:hypothetical protein
MPGGRAHNHLQYPPKFIYLARLAALKPTILARMHGSAWRGDGAKLLLALGETFGTP